MVVASDTGKRPSSKPVARSGEEQIKWLRMMMLIRRFEENTYREYSKPGQKIGGFCHLYSGQEAVAVGIAALLDQKRDYLINAYRCHGHSLALGMSARSAMAELFGKATGCSRGKGGSMHLFQADHGNMGGHGIVGGHLPVAVGMAFAQRYKKTGGVTFCLFGDGAINQGTHNEALNLASLYKSPVIFIVENNGVAMGTEVRRHSAVTDLSQRASGYNMPARNIDGNDIDTVLEEFGKAVDRARSGDGPSYLVANTYRFRGHSMSDNMKTYRTSEELAKARETDPITLYADRLRAQGLIDPARYDELEASVREEVADAIRQADADPHPETHEMYEDVLSETYPYLPAQ